MEHTERSLPSPVLSGLLLAPLHPAHPAALLNVCLLLDRTSEAGGDPFVILRDVPGSRVYLGVVCDAAARVHDWVEIWVQDPQLRQPTLSPLGQCPDNETSDRRWQTEFERVRRTLPLAVIVTGWEENHPVPLRIELKNASSSPFVRVEPLAWQLCRDDEFLRSLELPAYSSSNHRYLAPCGTDVQKKKSVVATSPEAPVNAQVQDVASLLGPAKGHVLFNPHAGLIRVLRCSPLELEDYLNLLDRPPAEPFATIATLPAPAAVRTALEQWATPRTPARRLVHESGPGEDLAQEIFFLKVSALLDVVREAHSYVRAHQLPLLNLAPSGFRVSLPCLGEQFPALWAARVNLARPSNACPLKFRSAGPKHFVPLEKPESSLFAPQALGAHAFGAGSVRIRNVVVENHGVILEGSLVAEDYLALRPRDLLWFKLPLGQDRLEFFAEVSGTDRAGPKEVRFRTAPSERPDAVVSALQRAVGTVFQRSPYELWPFLSSPADLFSTGVLAVRILLGTSRSNLPALLEDVLNLAHRISAADTAGVLSELSRLSTNEPKLMEAVRPPGRAESPDASPAPLFPPFWLEAIAITLRLFPGIGPHSYCIDPSEVPAAALHAVFEQPLADLSSLAGRLRTSLLPGAAAEEEIAAIIRAELGA